MGSKSIYILEADPTRYGGIQGFVRTLAGYLPRNQTFLLAYYGGLAEDRAVSTPLIRLNGKDDRNTRWKRVYLSGSSFQRNLALLLDIPRIRKNMRRLLPGGDTLVLNSAFAMTFLCPRSVLRSNRVILVQHTAPHMMRRRAFDFGGLFRSLKIACFRQFVDTFVMLSPYEKAELSSWLPLEGKRCPVIRHTMAFPENLPADFPRSAAVLARLIPLKRIDRVIACARLLPDVQFNIYGDGPEKALLEKMADGLNNVFFRGYTSDIDAVFRENSILLITSDYEGYCISGIEACVRGRPVIVLNTYPAANDLVEDHVSGIVLDDFSPEALANAVGEVLADPRRYRDGALKHRELYSQKRAEADWNRLIVGEKDAENHN